jgi:hypothetical protein
MFESKVSEISSILLGSTETTNQGINVVIVKSFFAISRVHSVFSNFSSGAVARHMVLRRLRRLAQLRRYRNAWNRGWSAR